MRGRPALQDVEAVTFDLDGTLVRYRRPPERILEQAFDAVDVEPFFTAEAYMTRFNEFLTRTDSLQSLRRECFAELAADNGRAPALGREVATAFERIRDNRNVRLLPGADLVLETLAARNVPSGIITNGPPEAQRTKIDATGIGLHVDTIVFAGTETPAKPDPAPFEAVLDTLEVSPAGLVHVGDSRADVRGAKAASCRTVYIGQDSNLSANPDWSVPTIEALGDLL